MSDGLTDIDPATIYEKLKAETAEMLRLNVDSPSLLENLQVDLVSLLRLEVDTMQGKVLSGEQVDLNRLQTALTMLRQLLPEKALVSAPPPPETRFGSEHRERLRRIIEKTLQADDMNKADVLAREELAAIAAADTTPAPVIPPPPVTPPPPDNVVPIDGIARANANRPPANYLRDGQPREPWRDGGGALCAPFFPVDPRK